MVTKREVIDNLLNSIAGVLVFISVAFWIDINGFSNFAPFIIGAGILFLLLMDKIVEMTPTFKFVTKGLVKTVAYIAIFIGTHVYLEDHLDKSWPIFLIIGIILLNNHTNIAKFLTK